MTGDPAGDKRAQPPDDGGDRDGVRITRHAAGRGAGRTLGVVALVVLAGLAGYYLLVERGGRDRPGDAQVDATAGAEAVATTWGEADPGQAEPPRAASVASAMSQVAGAPPAARDGEDPTPDLSDYMRPGEAPSMGEVIEGLHRRGIRTGLGAFQPPGTSPPLLGLEVPADFVLPEGYVRHHQATDDGQRIAPILMFSPDLRFVDVRGRRVPVPADRLVTPDLAPPGFPLRLVRIPPPRDGGGSP